MTFARLVLAGAAVVMALLAANSGQPTYAASFIVTNTIDSGPRTLRQAILDANASPGTDLITFHIPGGGPYTIQPTTALPTITDPVVIDGYTQAGASPNTNGLGLGTNAVLKIELAGSVVGPAVGLYIAAGDSTVRGLVINRFASFGVQIAGADATGNLIEGNFIGTDVTGTVALGNEGAGVFISGSNNTIGGTTAGARNVISGNGGGVSVCCNAAGNVVAGNYIGTDVTGTVELGNTTTGIAIDGGASNNTLGGTTAGSGNVISGNAGHGVFIKTFTEAEAVGNLIQGNFIGTDASGTAPLGNGMNGVLVTTSNNTVGGFASGAGNTIAFNSGEGVGALFSATLTGMRISSNSIFSNGALGIDLAADGVTPNDVGDRDTGPNFLQNFPVLGAAIGGSTIIEGSLNSTSRTTFRLEFFSNSACDPSGFGEGETFLGTTNVTTDGTGDVNFTVTLPETASVGEFVTSTATDPGGNTSEFSQCVQVAAAPDADGDGIADPLDQCPNDPEDLDGFEDADGCPDLLWADVDCDSRVDSGDAMKIAQWVAGLVPVQEQGCPEIGSDGPIPFGDVDCDGEVDSGDAMKLAQWVGGLSPVQEQDCPAIGGPMAGP